MFDPIKLRKQSNYNAELEHLRRIISKPKSRSLEPYFVLNNLDLFALYETYPNECPEVIKSMYDVHGKDLIIPSHFVKVRSPMVNHHPKINRYNSLVEKITTNGNPTAKDSLLIAEYDRSRQLLDQDIISDIKSDFITCLGINTRIEKILKPHIDTLLFVCLYYYNLSWDTYGLMYNSNIAYYTADTLLPSALPFDYRGIKQVNFISGVLYDYFKSSNDVGRLSITAGIRNFEIEDPIISKWIITSMLKDIPASTGYHGMVLQKLIDAKSDMNDEEWLKELKKLMTLEPPNYSAVKRKMVREWCLNIHRIFSYYLKLPIDTFNGKRLNIYVKLLKAFNIDNFYIPLKTSDTPSRHDRPDAPQTRLRDVLTKQTDSENASL